MIENVVVALDGSDHARRAADLAGTIAAKFGAKVHLLYVLPRHEVPEAIKSYAAIEHVEHAGDLELEAAGEKVVEPARQRLLDRGVGEVEGHVLMGDPVETIIDFARRRNADMIFAGRRGLGPLEGVLLGSVSAKLNHHAECTVVTVR